MSFLFFQWKWKSCILGVYGWIFGHDVPGCRPRLNFGHTLSRFTYLMHISVCIFKLSVICHCTAFVSCFSNKPNGTRSYQGLASYLFFITTQQPISYVSPIGIVIDGSNSVKIKLGAREEVDTFLECADSATVKEDFNSGLELEAVNNKKGVRLLSLDKFNVTIYYILCSA